MKKNILKKLIKYFYKFELFQKIFDIVINECMNNKLRIIHNGIEMKFCVPNKLNKFRVKTFSTKEPETLEWIESLPENSVLWDIGSNIGLYTIYSAKKRNCHVYAFEPSFFNVELLARNLYLNNLENKVNIIPLALSNQMGSNSMQMTTTEWGCTFYF